MAERIKIKGVEINESLYPRKSYFANQERYGEDTMGTCVICGKGLKDTKSVPWLRTVHYGDYLTEYEGKIGDDEGGMDMGWFPCGTDCYRKRYLKNEREIEIEA